jgi:hypothetical protein
MRMADSGSILSLTVFAQVVACRQRCWKSLPRSAALGLSGVTLGHSPGFSPRRRDRSKCEVADVAAGSLLSFRRLQYRS